MHNVGDSLTQAAGQIESSKQWSAEKTSILGIFHATDSVNGKEQHNFSRLNQVSCTSVLVIITGYGISCSQLHDSPFHSF